MKKQNDHASVIHMKTFGRLILYSIIGTYLVILAGAVVRGTGSGLGCPDWPTCFGQWVPPTDISQLPANYKDLYKISGKTIADFEAFKTWTEYVNRLLGVILGFLIVLLFGFSFKVKKLDRRLPWFCGGLLILILIQGGVGALVVSTHLKPFLITIHMLLAVLLLFGLLYLQKYFNDLGKTTLIAPQDKKALLITKILVGTTFFQVMVGTQVRQQVDHYTRDTLMATQETIMNFLGGTFYFHRTFSILIIGLFIYLLIYLKKNLLRNAFTLALFAFICVLGNVFTGIALNYFGFPANAQPPHLFFGVLTLGLLYTLYLNLRQGLLEE